MSEPTSTPPAQDGKPAGAILTPRYTGEAKSNLILSIVCAVLATVCFILLVGTIGNASTPMDDDSVTAMIIFAILTVGLFISFLVGQTVAQEQARSNGIAHYLDAFVRSEYGLEPMEGTKYLAATRLPYRHPETKVVEHVELWFDADSKIWRVLRWPALADLPWLPEVE